MLIPTDHDPNLALELSQLFSAKRERVYRAWTNQDALEKWFGPEGFATKVMAMEFEVGGHYRYQMVAPDGTVSELSGRYQEIVPNSKLVFTWRWEDWDDTVDDSLVTVEFHEKGEFTEVALTHQNLSSLQAVEDHKFGWTSTLEANLVKFLA